LQGQAPNNENTLRLLGGTRRLTFSRREEQVLIIIIIEKGNKRKERGRDVVEQEPPGWIDATVDT
jgi:hypothetical protein